MPGCEGEGLHLVPKSKLDLSEKIWVCLAHARAHNESWDYFTGMSETEIAQFQLDAMTGHRPTWPMGKRGARARSGNFSAEDKLGNFQEEPETPIPRPPIRRYTGVQLQALAMMNLEDTATLQDIKARYKELVKRFHPDANGGDRGAEERLKQVIKAYTVLKRLG